MEIADFEVDMEKIRREAEACVGLTKYVEKHVDDMSVRDIVEYCYELPLKLDEVSISSEIIYGYDDSAVAIISYSVPYTEEERQHRIDRCVKDRVEVEKRKWMHREMQKGGLQC